MNYTKKYYQSIYTSFAKSSQDDIQSVEPSRELNSKSQLDSEYFDLFNGTLNNKR